MSVYKQFNTNEVVVSPFKANKRFRFEGSQVSSSDVQIEYYQSQQGRYLSGSFDTGFNTMQDGVNIFHSIKQLYYSNYLTSSFGDPISTSSIVPGPVGPQGENLGYDQIIGNVTGPNFENFLQSSITQDRKFAQFSASVAPIGEAGTDTKVSRSLTVNYNSTPNDDNITFPAGQPNLTVLNPTIDDTYLLSTVTWTGDVVDSPFLSALAPLTVGASISANSNTLTVASGGSSATVTNQSLNQFSNDGIGIDGRVDIICNTSIVVGGSVIALQVASGGAGSNYKSGDKITITAAQLNPLFASAGITFTTGTFDTFTIDIGDLNPPKVQTVNANQLLEERFNPDVFLVADTPLGRGLTLKPNSDNIFKTTVGAGNINLDFVQAPRGPSVISIPSMLYGEAIQPSSFQFKYTSSINFTRSIVDDDGQGNLIVTQSNAAGVPFFSGSVGQIFYSQGIAVITGPDSGSLREFAHNVGYKNNMNPNIVSSSLSYSSSITIDENQYKCSVRDSEFLSTTNPSALGPSGELTRKPGKLIESFDAQNLNLAGVADQTFRVLPGNIVGEVKATTFFTFGQGRGNRNTIGQQYVIELVSSQGESLEFVGSKENGNGRNVLGQQQFNTTGSAVAIAQGFCDAVNSVDGFGGAISASLQSVVSGIDTVMLTQGQAGSIGNTFIKYTDSFNELLAVGAYAPKPPRGQVRFGSTYIVGSGIPQPVDGEDTFESTKGAILNITVANNAVTNVEVSSSITSLNAPDALPPLLQEFSQSFTGQGYNVGDRLQILASQLGAAGASRGTGSILLTENDVEKQNNLEVYHDFVTGSYFSPYVTTVGLYNETNDLVVVGKFPRPLPISLTTDTTYIINFDTN